MTIINTWNVLRMDAYPEYEDQTNVVFTVHWDLVATKDVYESSLYGSTGIALSNGSTFTPYEDLTIEQVIGWVQSSLGAEQVEVFETVVANQIQSQIKPTIISPPLPWDV